MKALITLLALFSATAFAETGTNLVKGDLSLSAAKGTIVSVSEICPYNPNGFSCMAVGSKVVINVGLHGCLDRLGGYSSKLEVVDGKGVLYFSALNIHNEKSQRVRCLKQPSETVTIHTSFEGEIELVNLDFVGINK